MSWNGVNSGCFERISEQIAAMCGVAKLLPLERIVPPPSHAISTPTPRAKNSTGGDGGCGICGLFLWIPGWQAKLQPGTVISAWVPTTVQLDSKALNEFHANQRKIEPTISRVYFYSSGPNSRVQVDGKPIGRFGANQYECVSLSKGTHLLNIDGAEMDLYIPASHDCFVRIEDAQENEARSPAELTEGFESVRSVLTPAHAKKSAVDDCLH